MSGIADLRKGKNAPRPRQCPRCGQATATTVVEVKIRDSKSRARAGTTASRSKTICESCAVDLFKSLTDELGQARTRNPESHVPQLVEFYKAERRHADELRAR
jgi:hypothetical protein